MRDGHMLLSSYTLLILKRPFALLYASTDSDGSARSGYLIMSVPPSFNEEKGTIFLRGTEVLGLSIN